MSNLKKSILNNAPWMKNKVVKRILQLLLFLFTWLYLGNFSSQRNNKEVFHYQAEIFADKAGYYVYLPATFIYGFDASKFPSNVDEKTGNGFTLEHKTTKIKTKYTSGIAILATPFFLVNHFYQKAIGEPSTGFTKSYFKTMNYASVFYLLIGLIFLFYYLKNFYKSRHIIVGLGILFLTTHLFYYSLVDTFMSHIYSFSMFSIYLWAFQKYSQTQQRKYFILIAVLVGFIILIRPINVLFLGLTLFLNLDSLEGLKHRMILLFKPWNLLMGVFIILLIFLPQLFYFKYISGSFIYYSYTNESFTNLTSPKILEVLFSPMNGLLIYTPVFLLFLVGMWLLIRKKNVNGGIAFLSFLAMIYISASWWIWSWGCSYSSRPMVDILPLLSIAFIAFIQWLFEMKYWIVKLFFALVISFMAYVNVKLSNSYSHCFMGTEWDWKEYNKMMRLSNVFPFYTTSYRALFDNEKMKYVKIITQDGKVLKVGDYDFLKVDTPSNNYHMDEFGILELDDSKFVLKGANDKYVSSDLDNYGTCISNRDEIGIWEKFQLKSINNSNYFVMVNVNGDYIMLDSLNHLVGNNRAMDKALHVKFESIQQK